MSGDKHAASTLNEYTSKLITTLRKDCRRLLGAGVPHLFAALLGTRGLGMFRRVLLARILTVAELGQMTYAMRIVDLVVILADLGICTAVLKFASESVSEEQKQRIYFTGLIWSLVCSSLVATLYMTVVLLSGVPQEQSLRVFMLLLVPYIPLAALGKTPLLFMQARKEIKRAAKFTIITQVISLVLVIGATYRFHLWGFFVTVTVAPLSNLVILLLVTRTHLRWLRPTFALLRKLVSFGFFSMLANTAGLANTAAAIILLKAFSGSDESVGIYAVGAMVFTATQLLPKALLTTAFPYLSTLLSEPTRFALRIRELAIKQAAIVLGLILVWYLLGAYAISLVFGNRYAPSFAPSMVLMLSLLPFACGSPYAVALLVANRVRLNFMASLTQLLSTIGFCVIFIPYWNVVGAAWAVLASQVVASTVSVLLARSALRKLCIQPIYLPNSCGPRSVESSRE